MVGEPTVVKVTWHDPALTAAEQPLPPVTVMVPVGVPAPGAFTVTVQLTVTSPFTTDGSGVSLVTVVVVDAFVISKVTAVAVLPLWLLSPAYVAFAVAV